MTCTIGRRWPTGLLFLVFLFLFSPAGAQDAGYYQLADERQLWRTGDNAAGLALDMRDSSDNRGVAFFDLRHRSGDYRRVQEGGQQNQLRFFTERYQKIGKYLYGYGSFDFDMGRLKDRAWSDVLRTYDSNPFISGSSVRGKYDFQNFTLRAKLSSVQIGHFNYGAAIYYKVGDLSRLRDPRSRVRLADYQVTPSVIYTFGKATVPDGSPSGLSATVHSLGLSAHYRRYKEKLVGLTTVQTDPNLQYYTMSGMEYASGSVGAYSSYSREYVNHEFGGELSYGYRQGAYHSRHAVTFSHGTEYAYGQYKYEPGLWVTNRYGFNTQNRLRQGRLLHSLDAAIGYEEGYADQYNQELVTEKDGAYTTQYWRNKMTYRKRYQLKKLDLGIHYRLSLTDGDRLKGYAGVRYDWQRVSNKHLLATSQLKHSASLLGLEGGCGLVGQRLWVHAGLDRRISHRADLDLSNPATDYAVAVLIPDMEYYRASYWQGRLELLYQQPLTIKGRRTLWFAKLYGSYLKTANSLDGKTAGLTVGLYY